MNLETDSTKSPAPSTSDKVTFQDVVAYLHGVTDAVEAMHRGVLSVRPGVLETPLVARANAEVAPLQGDPKPSARLTLRHGETEIELEGRIVVSQTPSPFPARPARGGTRLVDFDGTGDTAVDHNDPLLRGTLPYWAPAVSLVPLRPFAGATERPLDLEQQRYASLPYSALALSLVPIAPAIPSGWPDDGCEERVSGIRLRSAPLSAELYALTGTSDWDA
jgi:hypothetical protein